MEVKLQKWGNSLGIRIPKYFISTLKMKENDYLNIEQVDDKVIITKSKKNKVSLKELFDKYEEKNLTKDFSWDENVGEEIW